MAIYHAPEDKNAGTFAGGTIMQAMAKHKHMHKGEDKEDSKDKVREHLDKASEHIEHARAAHSGMKSESEASDPHEINEESGGGGISEVMGAGE